MQKINSGADLKAAILQLESNQAEEGKILKEQFHLAYESIKPINLLKNVFNEIVDSQDLKNKVLNAAVGLGAGFISKKLFEGVSHGPLRKLLGTALMFGITNVVTKNPEIVKSLGNRVLEMFSCDPDDA